eukprot:GHVP01011513.1.p1 GENE.GHVP01011513.1~~GHVP01011513.1.p1  ORF type:complete len:380 (+),score=68.58 GHVP01011513.1:141-1280(+)
MTEVVLEVYDLSRGMAAAMSQLLIGKRIEGIYHTGVRVFGLEYFFGGGIVSITHERVLSEYNLQPFKSITLGATNKTKHELEAFLHANYSRFTTAQYDLLHWNCNHFSEEVSKFLLGTGIPANILHQHEEIAGTPRGKLVLDLIKNFQTGMQQQMQQSGGDTLWSSSPDNPDVFRPEESNVSQPSKSATSNNSPDEEFKQLFRHLRVSKPEIVRATFEAATKFLKAPTDPSSRVFCVPFEIRKEKEYREAFVMMGFDIREENVVEHPAPDAPSLRLLKQKRDFIGELIGDKTPLRSTSSSASTSSNRAAAENMARNLSGNFAEMAGRVAVDNGVNFETLAKKLESMGFEFNKALEILKEVQGNMNAAIDKLINYCGPRN